jgi:hypothetical protein
MSTYAGVASIPKSGRGADFRDFKQLVSHQSGLARRMTDAWDSERMKGSRRLTTENLSCPLRGL